MESHEIYGQVTRIELVAGSEYATATVEIGASLNKTDSLFWPPRDHLFDSSGTITLKGKPTEIDGKIAVMYRGIPLKIYQWVKLSPSIVEWDDLPWVETAKLMRQLGWNG